MVNPVKRQYANRLMATSRAARGDRRTTGSRQASAGKHSGARTQSPSVASIEVAPLVHVSGPSVLALQLCVVPVGANSRAAAVARATMARQPHQRESRTPPVCTRSAQGVRGTGKSGPAVGGSAQVCGVSCGLGPFRTPANRVRGSPEGDGPTSHGETEWNAGAQVPGVRVAAPQPRSPRVRRTHDGYRHEAFLWDGARTSSSPAPCRSSARACRRLSR